MIVLRSSPFCAIYLLLQQLLLEYAKVKAIDDIVGHQIGVLGDQVLLLCQQVFADEDCIYHVHLAIAVGIAGQISGRSDQLKLKP